MAVLILFSRHRVLGRPTFMLLAKSWYKPATSSDVSVTFDSTSLQTNIDGDIEK